MQGFLQHTLLLFPFHWANKLNGYTWFLVQSYNISPKRRKIFYLDSPKGQLQLILAFWFLPMVGLELLAKSNANILTLPQRREEVINLHSCGNLTDILLIAFKKGLCVLSCSVMSDSLQPYGL